MLKAGVYREYDAYFFLDESKLRKISNIIQSYADKLLDEEIDILYSVFRKNNSYYDTSDLETVVNDENGNGKEIDTLVIHISNKNDNKDFFYIEFSSVRNLIRFNIQFRERDWCYLFADEMDSQINRIIKNKPLFLTGIKSLVKITSAIGLLTIVGLIIYRDEVSIWNYINKDGIMAAVVGGFLLGLLEPQKYISKFARSTFYWGDTIEVHDKLVSTYNNIKWVVGIGALVSFATGILTKYI